MKKKWYLLRTLAAFLAVLMAFGSATAVYAAKKPVKHKIAIDAGHQLRQNTGREPIGPGSRIYKQKVSSGTYGRWSKLNEYELNLTIAKKLEKELKKRGYAVYMVRRKDNVNLSNKERAQRSAKAGADILVRIHANGDDNSSVYGALTMAPASNNPYMKKAVVKNSQKLSSKVLNSFCKATKAKKRSIIYTNDMSGINWSTIPVTIVEMGFMSNRTEDLNMAKASYQKKMVKGIADGIDAYFK